MLDKLQVKIWFNHNLLQNGLKYRVNWKFLYKAYGLHISVTVLQKQIHN